MAAALALLGAACGDDDDGAATATTAAGEATTAAAAADTTGAAADTTAAATETTAAAADTTAAPAADVQTGGSLLYLHQFETRGFDPLLFSGALGSGGDAPQAYAVYDTLLYEDQHTGELVPRIAESFESDDATVWTLKLRPDVTFSDGTPYDAEAVKFNWERIADPANQSPNAGAVAGIASMTVVDPLTLEITLASPSSQFPRIVARRVGSIASPTAIREKGANLATEPVGAGPFILESWLRDSEARFTRNPNYWDAPKPYIDELIIRQVPDTQQRYNSVLAGEAQLAWFPLNANLGEQAPNDGLQSWSTSPGGGSTYLLNGKKPPFDDVRARQALAHALNLEQLNETVFMGANGVPTTLFSESSPFYDASLTLPQYDKETAQELLDELAAEKGGPLTFTIKHSASAKSAAEFFQAQLTEFDNLSVSIAEIQNTDILPTAQSGDYEAMSFQISMMDPEPDFYDNFHTGAVRNFVGYSSPEMDAALDAGRVALDDEARAAAYATMQEVFATDVPQVFYNRPIPYMVGAENLHDVEITNYLTRFEQVWLES